MIRKIVLTTVLLGLFSVCRGQEDVKPSTSMPKGKLLRVEYAFNGMRLAEYSNFDLKRSAETGKSEFSFHHRISEVTIHNVADSLFTAVSRIIEEERMFEYESYYGLPPELEQGMHDGFKWRFDACFEDGVRIHSTGRHVLPDGKGLQRIERLLYHAAEAATKATPDEE